MTKKRQYDAIVIGAGQAGGPLSTTLANAGLKTALIEREHLGGTCINNGCTPSKTMAYSARVAHLVGRATEYGIQTGHFNVNLKSIRKRKNKIVESFRKSTQRKIEENQNLDVLRGEAKFVGIKSLEINLNSGIKKHIFADKIFINVGVRPDIPSIKGLESINYLDSTSIMELDMVPERLLIVGGGYIGVEFGQMFKRFGSSVTIVQQDNQLLPGEDEDIAKEIFSIFEEEKIKVLLDSEASSVHKSTNGYIRLHIHRGNKELVEHGTHLLIAAGRRPNSDRLDVLKGELETDSNGYLKVNHRLETNLPGVYALGDIKGGPAFTHISYDDYRIIRANLINGDDKSTNGRLVPYTVFIDPQLGRVGLTEKEAISKNYQINVAKMPMSSSAQALEWDETRGLMKAVINKDNGQILGCAVLGIKGGELASVLQMAMIGNVKYQDIRDGVFAHPTLAESLNNLFMSIKD
jgi:pyruvate/2-oxoglutarate dehydrogenase complex dihydrolipoamide dehydrogenase (E3) component